jgi:hypothetical protein
VKREHFQELGKACARMVKQALSAAESRLTDLERAFKAMTPPKDGIDGRDGIDGKDGRNGIDGKSFTIEDARPLIEHAIKSIPTPKDGRDGVDGKDGAPGRDGVDGKSFTIEEVQAIVAKAITEKQAEWALDFERRATERHDRWLSALPKPQDGKDGRDAIQLEGFDLTIEGRSLTVSMKAGESIIQKTVNIPTMEYMGVFKDGSDAYQKGDCVTFGGSLWVAEKDKPSGKPEQSPDWKLAVKRGRDGREVVRTSVDKGAPVKRS